MSETSKQHVKLLTGNPIWTELMNWIDKEVGDGALELLEMEEEEAEQHKIRLKAWKDLKSKILAKIHNSL